MSKDFGAWMKERRMERNWNQTKLAEKVGVHLNTIIRWESGTQFPTLDMAERIIEVFGWRLKTVMGNEDDAKTKKRSLTKF